FWRGTITLAARRTSQHDHSSLLGTGFSTRPPNDAWKSQPSRAAQAAQSARALWLMHLCLAGSVGSTCAPAAALRRQRPASPILSGSTLVARGAAGRGKRCHWEDR